MGYPNMPIPTLKDILALVAPELGLTMKHHPFRRVYRNEEIAKKLLRIENPDPLKRLKVGILFAKQGQELESEMFGNGTCVWSRC